MHITNLGLALIWVDSQWVEMTFVLWIGESKLKGWEAENKKISLLNHWTTVYVTCKYNHVAHKIKKNEETKKEINI